MSVKITPILGIVLIKSGGDLEKAKPANNNTRWIFDVEGALEEPLVVQLVEMRTGKELSPDLVACSFLARSSQFYDAQPFMAEQVGGLVTIVHGHNIPAMTKEEAEIRPIRGVPCRYRVMIDVLHTATR